MLINNAGLSGKTAFAETPWPKLAAEIQLMVTAVTELCHRVLPGMRERGWGRIVNLSSLAAFSPPGASLLYTGIKSYVLGMSQSLDMELKPQGIHVTALCPGFTHSEFHDTMGTRDPSPFLAAPAALDLMREVGLERIWAWNHALAWESARRLCARWDTAFTPEERLIGTMATLPLPERLGSTHEDARRLRDALLFEDRIEVQLHAFRGRLWARISAQIYTDATDMDALGDAIASLSRVGHP